MSSALEVVGPAESFSTGETTVNAVADVDLPLATGETVAGSCGPTRPRVTRSYHRTRMAEERELSVQEQLEGIGTQLDWVRGYL